MFGKIYFLNDQKTFSNDDSLPINLELRPHTSDIHEVDSIAFSLVCEGTFVVNDVLSNVQYFETEPIIIKNDAPEKHLFNVELKFPPSTKDLPSSLTFDEVLDGIRWFVKAAIYTKNHEVFKTFRKSVFYVPSVAEPSLPPVFKLVDYVHKEQIMDTDVTIITSHSAAGLPQVPLAAGIGLTIECGALSESQNIRIRRLRIVLNEHNHIVFDDNSKRLPARRWLLSDHSFCHGIRMVSNSKLNLDSVVSKIRVDHANIIPTFNNHNLFHTFDLHVQLTLEVENVGGIKRINSLSPVTVLPRVLGTDLISPQHTMMEYYDSADITDSSDDDYESSVSDFEFEPSTRIANREKENELVMEKDILLKL